MLSYMLPVDEKPPPGPGKARLQLSLSANSNSSASGAAPGTAPTSAMTAPNAYATAPNGRPSPISKETSVSSLASDVTTATVTSVATATGSATPSSDRGKVKATAVNGKHPPLKRVSFGSSKGSMVETLIFESPVQEEPEPSPIPENGVPYIPEQDPSEAEREKVRVTFFQQSKPLEVDLPDEPVFTETDFMMASPVTMNETNHVIYNRTESVESGWENPFRPGGDLSREADEIVELIKGGKPITPTPGQAPSIPNDQLDGHHQQNSLHPNQEPVTQSPKKATQLNSTPKSANGTTKVDAKPGAVDVQRTTLKPQGNVQVEHVNIKKKPKCKCCVIQ